jgi:hypothetical protein
VGPSSLAWVLSQTQGGGDSDAAADQGAPLVVHQPSAAERAEKGLLQSFQTSTDSFILDSNLQTVRE